MAVTTTTATTYESRPIDSGTGNAIFKVVTTTTIRTSPDTPVGTTISESLTFEAVDYSAYYQQFIDLASGDGLHIIGPYDYIGLISSYKALVEEGSILKPATIQKSSTKDANARISDYLEIIKSLPKLF